MLCIEDIRCDIKYNSFRGAHRLKELVCSCNDKRKVLVYFDPDVDGAFAGFFVCRLLSSRGIPFSWYINSKRSHDFELSTESLVGYTVIAVDFQISADKIKELVDGGVTILSMDHHVNGETFIEYENNGLIGTVINNQYPFENEDGRYLSGAGVVFETMIDCFSEFDNMENRALVGITLLSDIRDIENTNARGYLYDLYNHKYKGYIRYLIDATIGDKDYTFGVPRLDRNYIDYKLSPILNSCFRFNEQDSVVKFLLGSGYIDKSYHTLQKELVKSIASTAVKVEFGSLTVCYFYLKDFKEFKDFLSNFVGLLASRYLDGSNSVISYLIDEEKVARASFRGRVNGLKYLDSLGTILTGVGHESAFGILDLVPKKSTFRKCSELCREVEGASDFSKKYSVTSSLTLFSERRGKKIGIDNSYCLSQNRTYVKYSGNSVKVKRSGPNYVEYLLDGISVMCFDVSLDPKKDLILPIMERGLLSFYLQEKG